MYAKPCLKWAGGKYRIPDKILRELPAGARFAEPFAASRAVYLNANFPEALVSYVVPFVKYKKPYFPLEELRAFLC